jgi:PLP dependent protein
MSYDLAEKLKRVCENISKVADVSGRKSSDITLVAVTKTRSIDMIREAIKLGITDIGENYVQETVDKYSKLGNIVKWHMIGHLQSNKIKYIIDFCELIHSVESESLAKEIGKRAIERGKVQKILVEVNIAQEHSKFGVSEAFALELIERISIVQGIAVCGIMGMVPFVENPEDTRSYFSRLKALWDKLPKEQRLYLSMGMTNDYEVAIEEGSNMVRIGTAIFGARD